MPKQTTAARKAAAEAAVKARIAEQKAARQAAGKAAEKAQPQPHQIAEAAAEAVAEAAEAEAALPVPCDAVEAAAAGAAMLAEAEAAFQPEAVSAEAVSIAEAAIAQPAQPKPEKSAFRKAADEAAGEAAFVYHGLSSVFTNHKKARPFAVYAESANRPNSGHAPDSLTVRDETATLIGLKLTGGNLEKPFNPGDLSGDKSACGIRAVAHGHYRFNADKSAFLLTERGKAVAEAVLRRINEARAAAEAAAAGEAE